MRSERTLTGTVVDSDGHAVAGAEVYAAAGDTPLASFTTDEDGAFTLQLPAAESVSVIVFAGEYLTWRSPLEAEPDDVDLGRIRLSPAEYDAGIVGQAWNVDDDCPVTAGQASLWRGSDLLAVDDVKNDGGFSFALSPSRLLPAGSYEVTVTALGYALGSRPVDVLDDVTLYLIGRVDLHPEVGPSR
jgi:hypothetical protein